MVSITKCSKLCGGEIPDTMLSLSRLFISDSFASNSNTNYSIDFLAAICAFYPLNPQPYGQLLS